MASPVKQSHISSFFSRSEPAGRSLTGPIVVDLTNDDAPAQPTRKRKQTSDKFAAGPSATGPGRKKLRGKKAMSDGQAFFDSLDEDKFAKKSVDDGKSGTLPKKIGDLAHQKQVYRTPTTGHTKARKAPWNSNEDPNDSEKQPARSVSRRKESSEIGPCGLAWTPLERRVRELKAEFPDFLLLVQEGYKYRFFGEDAKIASKELSIVCYEKRNFWSASIPIERKNVHVKKLISQGYKVGIVDQQETAALKKVGDNRSGLFRRGLAAVYTAATFIDDLESTDTSNFADGTYPSILCLVERSKLHASAEVSIGILSIVPSTGDVVYDSFDDGGFRSELETRLVHLRPHELLMSSKSVSNETKAVVNQFAAGTSSGSPKIRVDLFKSGQLHYEEAIEIVQKYYEHNIRNKRDISGSWMASIVHLPQLVVVALAHAIQYLIDFGLANVFTEAKGFHSFHSRNSTLLDGNTVVNLEIFHNQSEHTEHGSLLWLLDRTKTKFGSRLLKEWIARPLTDIKALESRMQAVDEIRAMSSSTLAKLDILLKGLPDLGKGLVRIQYCKSSPRDLSQVLNALETISRAFDPFSSSDAVGLTSPLLNDVVYTLPKIKEPVVKLLSEIDLSKARQNQINELWSDPDKFPAVSNAHDSILFVEAELAAELRDIRKLLHRPTLQYKTVADVEYLIEIPNDATYAVPVSWSKESKTKQNTRYHTPNIKDKLQERERYRETLANESKKAFELFLKQVGEHYGLFRDTIHKLALADCLFSLAHISMKAGYIRPLLTEGNHLKIVGGRHPMVEEIRSDPFIPSRVELGGPTPAAKIITGPNMGGKSSLVRMTALLCVMAQIGSYVPADAMSFTPVDAVLTRMGASDDLSRGKSTFMVEMSETANIIRAATARSLVILDELGRGTSTYDGMAIASSVLRYAVERIGCRTLFITHYPMVAEELQQMFPRQIETAHMGFIEEDNIDRRKVIHFLYSLKPGIAAGSFGIECARLAGLPERLLETATAKANRLQNVIQRKIDLARCRQASIHLRRALTDSTSRSPNSSIAHLRTLATAL